MADNKKKRPLYKMVISEEDSSTGVEFVSLVEHPAVEVNWVAFSKDSKHKFSIDNEKQMLAGPFMIANKHIFRYDEEIGEYDVFFDEDSIDAIIKRFNKQGRTMKLNVDHQEDSQIDAIIVEQWKTSKQDKSKEFGFDLPINSWFGIVHIEDKNFWNDFVKTGKVKGFSIEGWLNAELVELNKQIKNKINQMSNSKNTKFAEVKTKDGVTILTNADTFVVDAEVYTLDAEGTQVAVADGEYELESGDILVVAGGKVTEVKAMAEDMEKAEMAITPEDVQVIVDAIQPLIDELSARIEALETANTEMSTQLTKMSKVPGATSKTELSDETKKVAKPTNKEKVAMIAATLKAIQIKQKNK